MGLAQLAISQNQFESIYEHLDTHTLSGGTYRNMHMRESDGPTGERRLTYFHAMHAPPGESRIVGMLSGPTVFCGYEMTPHPSVPGRIQIVAQEDGDAEQLARIARRFVNQIFSKIAEDRQRNQFPPRRTSGQLYLKRLMGGIDANSPICREAVDAGELDGDFVDVLAPWNLNLYRHH